MLCVLHCGILDNTVSHICTGAGWTLYRGLTVYVECVTLWNTRQHGESHMYWGRMDII